MAVLTALLGGSQAYKEKLLSVYREELFEDAYKPAILRARRAEARKKAQETVDQAVMLQKVGKFTSAEPPPKKKGRRR